MQFSEFPLNKNVLKGISDLGYDTCTPVQAETLVHTLEGKDVFVQSQTGTGKTAAFLISLFQLMKPGKDRALIIAPTRELAAQIEAEARSLSVYLDFSIATIYGGVGYYKQEKSIKDGTDIMIGTPGRIIDLSDKHILNLKNFNFAVIDEADRLFDMGFVMDIRKILSRLPSRKIRQTMLYSATLSYQVKHLASDFMNRPAEVQIESSNITVEQIKQHVYHVGSGEKIRLLVGILNGQNFRRALIFSNTKQKCEEVAGRLCMNGFEADFLTGDLAQSKREQIINRFKMSELPILVATDVAARGIHVDDLELVVNFDVPNYCENYVHRIGRTARAGKSGTAITLACEIFVEQLAPIEQFIKMTIPSSVPEEELYGSDKSAGRNYRRRKKTVERRKSVRQERRTGPRKGTGGKIKRRYKKGGESSGKPENKTPKILPAKHNDQKKTKPAVKEQKKGFISRFTSLFKR